VRVVWAYDRDHRQHPFIVLSALSLTQAGHGVAVVSGDYAPGAPYAAWDDFSMQRRLAHWAHAASLGPLGRALGRLRYATLDLWAMYARGFRKLMALPADVIVASRPEAAVVASLAPSCAASASSISRSSSTASRSPGRRAGCCGPSA
jgi:hypothetical protein